MRVIILGSTGMLGQALVNEIAYQNIEVVGVSEDGLADITCDIRDDFKLEKVIKSFNPDVLINTVAIVNLQACENNQANAYLVNARPAGLLTNLCKSIDCFFVHISTDHYYSGNKDKQHDEGFPVVLLNEYARTKYTAECFALTNKKALVVRTNIVGFRGWKGKPTFIEWVVTSVREQKPIMLFNDFYTSSISVRQLSKYLLDIILINNRPAGILNIASRDVFCKEKFVVALASKLGYEISNVKIGSIFKLKGPMRAESLGLNIAKTEYLIESKLPGMGDVVNDIVDEYKEIMKCDTRAVFL
jgi:dTDP-4-dehydrorhamnose reductase